MWREGKRVPNGEDYEAVGRWVQEAMPGSVLAKWTAIGLYRVLGKRSIAFIPGPA